MVRVRSWNPAEKEVHSIVALALVGSIWVSPARNFSCACAIGK
jgi:hypothetical protein